MNRGKIKKIITGVGTYVPPALCLWLFASWLDVVLHNTTTCTYAFWNVFRIICEYL